MPALKPPRVYLYQSKVPRRGPLAHSGVEPELDAESHYWRMGEEDDRTMWTRCERCQSYLSRTMEQGVSSASQKLYRAATVSWLIEQREVQFPSCAEAAYMNLVVRPVMED